LQQSAASTPTLPRGQDVKLINPALPESYEANYFVFDRAPNLTLVEHTISEECSVLVGCVKPRQPRQSLVKRYSMDDSSLVHLILGQAPQREYHCALISGI
jgi:hypothetical protein